jgi:hypothetical protein
MSGTETQDQDRIVRFLVRHRGCALTTRPTAMSQAVRSADRGDGRYEGAFILLREPNLSVPK